MRKGRKFLATLLTFVCLMATSMSVMAAEPQTTPEVTTEAVNVEAVEAGANVARSSGIYGYAASYTSSTIGSFYINATGSSTSKGGLTIESYSFPSNDVQVAITLYRPDGTKALNTLLTGNQKIESISFSNAPAGQYKVVYNVFGTIKGWLGGWVFSK